MDEIFARRIKSISNDPNKKIIKCVCGTIYFCGLSAAYQDEEGDYYCFNEKLMLPENIMFHGSIAMSSVIAVCNECNTPFIAWFGDEVHIHSDCEEL